MVIFFLHWHTPCSRWKRGRQKTKGYDVITIILMRFFFLLRSFDACSMTLLHLLR